MEIAFLLKKLITQLVIPPFNLLLLILLGMLIAKQWPRVSRTLVWSSTLILLLLATPAVSRLLLQSINDTSRFDITAAKAAQAIVVLGGGLRTNTPEYGDTPNQFTLDRIRYGATIARLTHLPVLVTGGAVASQTAEATSMAQTLQNEFSVPVRWIEGRALDTEDNLAYSAALLLPENISTVLLVTHDFHMRRALAHCKRSGLQCIPAPVSLAGFTGTTTWIYQLPNSGSLQTSALALHEVLGNLALAFR